MLKVAISVFSRVFVGAYPSVTGIAGSQIVPPAKRVEDDIIFYYSAEFDEDNGEDRSLFHRSRVSFSLETDN